MGAEERLAQVDFAPIPGRVGQRIRNELVFQANGGGRSGSPPTQRLEIAIKESLTSDAGASRWRRGERDLCHRGIFRLIDIKNKQVVFQGTSHARAELRALPSIYSNVRAARRRREPRGAKVIADDVKTRLATYLSRDA